MSLPKECSFEQCSKPIKSCSYCGTHYLKFVFDSKRYEKTKKGFLMRKYRNMKSRVEGVQKAKYHLYVGRCLLPKEEFYEWAMQSDDFHELYDDWKANDYPRKLSPSVDRIDSSLGYSLDNMEWVTHSENSRRGASGRR